MVGASVGAAVNSDSNPASPLAKKTSLRVSFTEDTATEASFTLACLRHGHAIDIGGKKAQEDVLQIVPSLQEWLARQGQAEAWPSTGQSPAAFFAVRLRHELADALRVFDGHAGVHAAEFARDRLLSKVTEHEAFGTDLETCLRDAFLATDAEYYAAVQAGERPDSGATALAVLVWGSTLYVANAGDSRAVMCSGRKAVQLTRDHRPSCDIEAARIESAGGFISDDHRLNGQLSVSRALGNFSDGLKRLGSGVDALCGPLTAEPEVSAYKLTSEDEFLVLACDGLWEMFPNERVVELARASLKEVNDPAEVAKDLVEEAKRWHAADNLSVIMCCFSSEAPRRRTFALGRSWSCEALSSLRCALQAAENDEN